MPTDVEPCTPRGEEVGLQHTDSSIDVVGGNLAHITVVPEALAGIGGVHALEPGERAIVSGETNLRPDRNVITVALERNGTALTIPRAVPSWGTDGDWSTTIRIPGDLPPGNYTLDVDAGVTSRRVDVRVAAGEVARLDPDDEVRPGQQVLVVDNTTLPHGGYVVARDENVTVGTSTYLRAGNHSDVGIFIGTATEAGQRITLELWYGSPGVPCGPYTETAGNVRQNVTVRRVGR